MYKKIFSDRIRQLRYERQLRQVEVAKVLGIDRSQLSKWEHGDQEPGLDAIGAISRFYGVSIDWLFGCI